MNPLVSIVMANHNYGRFIEEAVRSVQAQDYPDLELIIVDDGSTDDSRSKIQALAEASGGRVRAIFQKNGGVAAARNAGIAAARGEYIGFLDADDALYPNSVSALADFLEQNPDVPMVYANSELFDSETGRTLGLWFGKESGRRPYSGHFAGELFFLGNFIPIQTALIRRRALDETGHFNPLYRVGEDWELWLRMTARYDVRYLDQVLSKIRRHNANISYLPLNWLIQLRILRRSLTLYPEIVERYGERALRQRSAESYYELGRALVLSGQRRRARRCFCGALQIDKRFFGFKLMMYYLLSLVPFTGLINAVRKGWHSLLPWRDSLRRQRGPASLKRFASITRGMERTRKYADPRERLMRTKVKVCILSAGLPVPPLKGGAIETLIDETAAHFKTTDAIIYSEHEAPYTGSLHPRPDLHYGVIPTTKWRARIQRALDRVATKGPFTLFGYFFVRAVARDLKFKPDVFHIHNHFYYQFYLKKRFPHSRFILHFNNEVLFTYKHLHAKYIRAIEDADRIIACSNFIKQSIVSRCPEAEAKISVISNGAALSKFYPIPDSDPRLAEWRSRLGIQDRSKTVIFVGRIDAVKGVDYLIEAFNALAAELRDIKLLIVGTSWFRDGRLTPFVRKVRELASPNADKIVFTGFIPYAELNTLYNLAGVAAVPSVFSEPFGMVIVEAMAAGSALVASAVGGIPEVVEPDERGLLVPPKDPAALASAMRRLLTDAALRQRLAANALPYVRGRFDWPMIAAKIEEVYRELA